MLSFLNDKRDKIFLSAAQERVNWICDSLYPDLDFQTAEKTCSNTYRYLAGIQTEKLPLDDITHSVISWAKTDKFLKDQFYLFWLSKANRSKSESTREYLIKYSLKYKTEENLYYTDLKSKRKESRNHFKSMLKSRLAKDKEKIKNEKAAIISNSLSEFKFNIQSMISLFTVLLVIGGYYFHTRTFDYLGLPPDGILTISDYLYGNLTTISYAFLWSLLPATMMIWGVGDSIERSITNTHRNDKSDKVVSFVCVVIILANVTAFLMFLEDTKRGNSQFENILMLNVMAVLLSLLGKIPFHYFRTPIKPIILTLVFVCYFFQIHTKSEEKIQNLKSDNYEHEYTIKVDNQTSIENTKIVSIGEKYTVLIDNNKNGKIIPTTNIKSIEKNTKFRRDPDFFDLIFKIFYSL
ncbi:hypothetical protein [Alteromonas macleodii]|uniref:Uncharacterized protein n=1 Tax=Alteromonas macleodii TaxID=28108 RepID=A0A6T9XXM7_ALTMA|nr:hypothetical protein [Alteromonas macleodii]CAB9492824.1 membrane protein of unknown function [Alteromonas macleodii]